MHRYWFKPKRFGIFAGYYPTTWQGWVVTLICLLFIILSFVFVDSRSHSASDTLLNFAPLATIILLIFDLMCFRTGEYPYWWKRWTQRKNS